MYNVNERVSLAEFVHSTVKELQKRVDAIDVLITSVSEEDSVILNTQKIAINDCIMLVQKEFLKKVSTIS